MDFQRLKYFLEVVKLGQFSKAAEACCVAQPSLSLQIQKLEDEVGGCLFLRSRSGVTLTDLGKDFLPHAQSIMAEVHLALGFRDKHDGVIRRPVKIGAIPTIAPYLLPSLVSHIRQQHPEASFEIAEDTTASLIQSLRMGTLDFALLSPPTEIDREVDLLSICEDELLLTLPTNHPLHQSKAIMLDELKDDRLILLQDAHCLSKQSEGFCKAAGLEPDVTISSSQIDTLLSMVELGMGYTFTPQMAIPFHQHRSISFHRIEPTGYFRKIQLVWMRSSGISATQTTLLSCIQKWNPARLLA